MGIIQIVDKAWHAHCFPKTGPLAELRVPDDLARKREAKIRKLEAKIAKDLADAKADICKLPRREPKILMFQSLGGQGVSTLLPSKRVLHDDGSTSFTTGLRDADRLAWLAYREVDQVEADLNETLRREEADRRAVAEGLPLAKVGEAGALRQKGNAAKSATARAWQAAAKAEYARLRGTDPKYRDYTQDAWSIELEQQLKVRADLRFKPKAGRIVKFMREHPDYFRHS